MRSHFIAVRAACLVILVSIALGANLTPGPVVTGARAPVAVGAPAPVGLQSASIPLRVFLPLTVTDYLPSSSRLCRFGVGGRGDYQVNTLRIGWYLDWTTSLNAQQPGGISYMPMVRLSQTGLTSYTYEPKASVLLSAIAARPGATWIIGNEPDCIWQDDMEPGVYARAYHDLYYLIKTADPTAKIAAGSIVQPSPLRLQYLDMVLSQYRALYGTDMPVDVWNTHAFILREEAGSWGADIPPGIDVTHGELYEIDDNDNITIFKESIRSFRQWMAVNGYQDSALIITEFGVQMPPDYGFSPERVKAFMEASFDYLLTARDPSIGDPRDDYRLVQQWAWYSLADVNFNGWLFDPVTRNRTVHGDHFSAYTARITPVINLAPISIEATPVQGTSGEISSAIVQFEVVNNGNIATETVWKVRLYAGDPTNGGELIGERYVSDLEGCGASIVLEAVWDQATAGPHTFTVVVDSDNAIQELNEQDNVLSVVVQF